MAEEISFIYYLTFIFEIGSILSIIFLVYSMYLIEKIKRLFPGGSIIKKWLIMEILIVIFIILHILGLIFILSPDQNISYIMSGILNLTTGLFVAIIINLNFRTYKVILHKTEKK